jgi:hypothetical protein
MSQDSRQGEWHEVSPGDFEAEGSAVPAGQAASPNPVGAGASFPADPLAMFASDDGEPGPTPGPTPAPTPAPTRGRRWKYLLALLVLVLVAGGVVVGTGLVPVWAELASLVWRPAAPTSPQEGRLVIESQPTGVPVEIDGVARGSTPLGVGVKAGHHLLRVGSTTPREIEVDVVAGVEVVHHVELPVSGTRLRIETVPTGAPVSIDGQARGVAPLDLGDLSVGPHDVLVGVGGTAVRRQVNVQPGLENSIVITLGADGGPAIGWLTVTAPVDLEIYEGTRLVGRSRDERLMLLAGGHDLAFVNRELGVDDRRRVEIAAGRVAGVRVQPANGQLNVNAVPWAEVFLDGTRIGETPIANFSAPIGTHEIVLRHPDLGEQRRTVSVGLGAPTRVGVSFRQ